MKLPKISINNYQFVLVIFALLTLAGINSYRQMPRTENPTIYIPGAGIFVIYPGANPVDMEQLVAMPIEEAVNELDDIKKIETTLLDGIAAISVEFTYGTNPKEKYDEVVQKVNSIKSDLPQNLFKLDVAEYTSTDVAILELALVGDSVDYHVLEAKADKLKKKIEKIKGVKKVKLDAYPKQELRVALDFEKMAAMNISLDMVANAIKSNNANIPGGNINIGQKSFGVITSGSYQNLDEIKNTVINSYKGKLVYLKNIAAVYFDFEDIKYHARFMGEKCLLLSVQQKEGINVFSIMENINPVVENYKETLPENITIKTSFDQSKGIDKRINGFMGNLLQGIVLVGLVILLALGFKSSLVVIIAIPLSIIVGLFFVDAGGFNLEQISIAGLVIALGLLVDNSIVIVENINRFIGMGHSSKDAAIKGTSEIGWAIVSSTVTTLFAFIPIVLMPDKAGDFIRSMPITIIATLSVSLFIALTLSPLIISKTFKGYKSKEEAQEAFKKKKGVEKLLRGFIEGPYRRLLKYCVNHKLITLLIALAILVGSVAMFKQVGVSFFPKAESSYFMIYIYTPEGSNLSETEKAVDYVQGVLDSFDEIELYTTNIGHGNPRIYYNVWPKSYYQNFADFLVEVNDYSPQRFEKLKKKLRPELEKYTGAKIHIKEFEQGVPTTAQIDVSFTGDNINTLKKLSGEVEKLMEKQPGIINIENNLNKNKTDIYFNINKEKANLFGVPIYEIDKTIRAAIAGLSIDNYRNKEGKEFSIVIRMNSGDEVKPEDFDKIYVKSLADKFIPIKQLADIEFKKAPGIVTRYNLERTARVTANTEDGYSLDAVMAPVLKYLEETSLPEGYNYRIGGELQARNETFGGMGNAVILAVISIFAVLVLQFRSFKQPLIIFMAVPLAIIGSIWALYLTGYTFSFTAFIGFTSLIGIVINNSIILVDYSNQLIRSGKSIEEAVLLAGQTRFTPIILTTLTTVGGLLPLTLQGGTMWAPMGWTIIGGLLVSTLLTLLIVPVLYKLVTR